jgi:hypothetical protein
MKVGGTRSGIPEVRPSVVSKFVLAMIVKDYYIRVFTRLVPKKILLNIPTSMLNQGKN